MKIKQFFFFATQNDLRKIIHLVEKEIKIKYYRAGLLDKEKLVEYSSLAFDNEVGIANYGDNNLCISFLVMDSQITLVSEEIPQRKGGVKFSVNQERNVESIFFRPGGVYENAIIEGKIYTTSANNQSICLFNLFAKEFKLDFLKIKGYLVGKEAFELYKKGWRLTQNINSPIEYDLQTP